MDAGINETTEPLTDGYDKPPAAPPAAAAPGDSDVEFVLRLFGANPARFIRPDGTLDRSALRADVDKYRSLYAGRVASGGYL